MKSSPAGNKFFGRYGVTFALLAILALYGFTAHSRRERIATPASSGDQAAYMAYARQMYESNYAVIGQRNRMPIYPFLLSLIYQPGMDEEQFLQSAQAFNVNLSIVLLLILFVIFRRFFSALHALALVTATAFGVFLYRAPYAQTEVVFYFASFCAFLLLLQMLIAPRWWLAVAGGIMIGLAYLMKASILPTLVLWGAVFLAQSLWCFFNDRCGGASAFWKRIGFLVIVISAFTAVILPYIRTNKRVFGQYLYNESSTFVMWCDSWPEGKDFLDTYGPGGKWRTLPPDQIPSATKYWREHSIAQIVQRLVKGLVDLVGLKMQIIGYYKFVALLLLTAVVLWIRRRERGNEVLGRKSFATAFCFLFLMMYIVLYAWYGAIVKDSRFILSIFLPSALAISLFIDAMGRDRSIVIAGGRYSFMPLFSVILAGLALVDLVYNLVAGSVGQS